MTEVEKLEIELDLVRGFMECLPNNKDLIKVYDDIQFEIDCIK